ncbi:type II secretion system F family protein [Desulfoscipio gibsoniae]
MQGLLITGFFVSVTALLMLVFVPSKYGDSALGVTVELLKNKLRDYIAPPSDRDKLSIINKTPEKVMLTSLTYGMLFGIIGVLITFNKLGTYSILIGTVVALLGIVIGRASTVQEYKKWQAKLFEGVPTLVNFFPAFLEVEGVTPREALALTLPFMPEPLKSEMWVVLDRITRTGQVDRAMNDFSARVRHPCVDAICIRLSSAWNSKVTPDLFEDLTDQVEHIKREAIKSKTSANTAILALVGVIGCLAVFSVFGYPAVKYITNQFGGF